MAIGVQTAFLKSTYAISFNASLLYPPNKMALVPQLVKVDPILTVGFQMLWSWIVQWHFSFSKFLCSNLTEDGWPRIDPNYLFSFFGSAFIAFGSAYDSSTDVPPILESEGFYSTWFYLLLPPVCYLCRLNFYGAPFTGESSNSIILLKFDDGIVFTFGILCCFHIPGEDSLMNLLSFCL